MVTKIHTNMNELHTHTHVVSKNIKNSKGRIYTPENINI